MPGAEVEAVVALRRVAGDGSEVVEVWGRVRGEVLVAADRGPRAGLVAPPGRVVAVREVPRSAVLIDEVAQGRDGSRKPVEEGRGGLIARGVTCGDISGREEGRWN